MGNVCGSAAGGVQFNLFDSDADGARQNDIHSNTNFALFKNGFARAIVSDIDDILEQIKLLEIQILKQNIFAKLLSKRSGTIFSSKQIIPDKIVTRAHLEKENFLKIIKAASFFAEPGVNDISLEFLPKKNSLLVTSVNNKIGEHAAEVKTEISGQPCKITFNYRYLIDGLANMGHGEISLEIVDSNTPGLIKSVDDPSYLYLIMPIQPR